MNKQDIHRFQEKFFDIIMRISLILLIATSSRNLYKSKTISRYHLLLHSNIYMLIFNVAV